MVTKETINITEAAVMLGVCEMTVRRMVYRGELAVVRAGRRVLINEKRLREYLDGQPRGEDPKHKVSEASFANEGVENVH